jgi:hypothetical protein
MKEASGSLCLCTQCMWEGGSILVLCCFLSQYLSALRFSCGTRFHPVEEALMTLSELLKHFGSFGIRYRIIVLDPSRCRLQSMPREDRFSRSTRTCSIQLLPFRPVCRTKHITLILAFHCQNFGLTLRGNCSAGFPGVGRGTAIIFVNK